MIGDPDSIHYVKQIRSCSSTTFRWLTQRTVSMDVNQSKKLEVATLTPPAAITAGATSDKTVGKSVKALKDLNQRLDTWQQE